MGFMEAWSKDSETDGWHPVHPSKPSGQPRQVATPGIPKLTDGTLSTPQKRSRGRLQVRLHPLRPSKASGCNSRDSETDGWHPVHPSKPSGQPQQVAILGIPCPPLKTLWAAAAGREDPKLFQGQLRQQATTLRYEVVVCFAKLRNPRMISHREDPQLSLGHMFCQQCRYAAVCCRCCRRWLTLPMPLTEIGWVGWTKKPWWDERKLCVFVAGNMFKTFVAPANLPETVAEWRVKGTAASYKLWTVQGWD